MKKLFFSAVMMMAFVGSSFAKTGEVEVKKVEKPTLDCCVYEGFAAATAAADCGATVPQQFAAAVKAHAECVSREKALSDK